MTQQDADDAAAIYDRAGNIDQHRSWALSHIWEWALRDKQKNPMMWLRVDGRMEKVPWTYLRSYTRHWPGADPEAEKERNYL